MATPTPKNEHVDAVLSAITGRDRKSTIRGNTCMFSELSPPPHNMEFKNDLSKKEYAISGLCQSCQDTVFSEEEW